MQGVLAPSIELQFFESPKFPLLGVWVSSPHLTQSGVAIGEVRKQSLRKGASFSKKKMASYSSKKKTMKTMNKTYNPQTNENDKFEGKWYEMNDD